MFGNAPLASTYHTPWGILLRKKMRFLAEAVQTGERMNSSLTGPDAKGSEQLLISSWFLMRTLPVKKLTTS